MQQTPRTLRPHIGLFGRRNVGKSSILNALVGQTVSIVCDQPGTTADPVEKPMELPHIGPVVFIDTAGMDDEGTLGDLRRQRSEAALDRADLGILVAEAGAWTGFEDGLLGKLKQRGVPTLVVFNKCDGPGVSESVLSSVESMGYSALNCSALTGEGLGELFAAIIRLLPNACFETPLLARDLAGPGETALLVTPIDGQAPKGRLILPQVMTIRDLLDGGAIPIVCQPGRIGEALGSLSKPPSIVITDSQAFAQVSEGIPGTLPMTSFSILMARFQGGLETLVRGASAISRLKGGDGVLVAETCAHHPAADDIGRVKIPDWINSLVGTPLNFTHISGRDFPQDLSPYKLAIHCGNCTGGRREMLARIHRCRSAGLPITNYGLAIAYSLGIFERALAPFPDALAAARPLGAV